MGHRKRRNGAQELTSVEQVAGNGLLHRRALLGRGIMLAGAMGTGVGASGSERGRRAAEERSVEPGNGLGPAALSGAVALREGRDPHPQQS